MSIIQAKQFMKGVLGTDSIIIPALLSALLLIPAYPPFEQGYLAWVALIPLITYSLKAKPVQALKAGLLFGILFHLYVNFYLTHVLFTYLSWPLAILAMILLVLYIGLYHGLFALTVNLVNRFNKPLFTAFAVPATWLLIEYLRSIGFLGYNVGYLGYSQWQYHNLLNLAALYGYWGLPFIIILFQTITVLAVSKVLQENKLAAATAIFILLVASGFILPSMATVEKEDDLIWTTLIQGNIQPTQIMGDRAEIKALYLDLTKQAVASGTDLVVWPETVIDLNFNQRKDHPGELTKTADELDVAILYGARIRENDKLYNSITLYKPGFEELLVYNKVRLVPFVEYFPAEEILNSVINLDLLLGSYSEGSDITLFEIKNKPLAGIICFESYFGNHTRLFAVKGAHHLYVLTNDAWFGRSIGLDQHAQAAAIRAAEMGIGVTQVANSGITISFDYQGREMFRSAKQERETLTASLDLARRDTFYNRYGDYFPAFWAIFLMIGIALLAYRKFT
ncbi:MAG: apolipoprotein N-acyltransferase [Bacillota bacterium]|nr:apolipoprotein N-acyltransferase [Bacillota bacterium]